MSGKVKNKGASNYDTQNNIMALEGDIDDQMKYKINKVMEVVKNRSQDDVMLVLQYFDYDIDTTVDAFLEDGASDILKKWNHTNSIKPTNKNKKKKKNKKKSIVQDTATVLISNGEATGTKMTLPLANGDTTSVTEDAASRVTPEEPNEDCVQEDSEECVCPLDSQTETEKPEVNLPLQRLKGEDPVERLPSEVPTESETCTAVKGCVSSNSETERSSVSPSESNRSTNRSRHRSSSGSQSRASQEPSRGESVQPPAPTATASSSHAFSQAPGKKILEKSLKDLSRQTVALQRVSNLLEEELDNSFKRVKTAISEAQRLLEERSKNLEVEMERVKKESRQLLNQRKDLAAELKQRTERASTMGEAELNELRADIKHFVVERKYDEELGKTCRFMWDKDRITEEIKAFGEVYHVKNSYSQRRQSVSSVASSSNMTSSITEPPELSPTSKTELEHEISESNQENPVHDTRPQGTAHPTNRARFFFSRNYTNSDSNRQPYNRGTYPPRGRGGGGGENRGGRGGGRGGRRDGGYRAGQDSSYYKPHYPSQRVDDHSGSGGTGTEGATSWPPRDQRAQRRGGGRHNPHYQGRIQQQHHSPRRNFGSDERVPAVSDSHVNGSGGAEASDLSNGFVDH